ncbi:Vacuolar membrane protease [Orchesella cincta]|uniref:Vacuolar membrane protease n=1 Tax=Orchesella cincta TaxID=48709 RepID=A0A1D2MUQ0_ORCCI|nr:Vacuolar membrane protease [Orchesella cincta]
MKNFIFVVFLIFSVIIASSSSTNSLGVRRIEITQVDEGAPASTLPIVRGTRYCGGPGQAVSWRYETCDGEGICQVPGDDNLQRAVEFEFIPSQDVSSLGVRFVYVNDGATTIFHDKPIADSSVQGGVRYILNAMGGPRHDVKGKTITLQIIIYRVETGDAEVCSEADFMIV